ncbi:hypothetical protein RCL_jg392.t1 [Rhizophagus clarus]|uniref:Uncharacterized protein n=1 Tax=Rhizophagus clarus TaxID=94130 RepID=A0A8H3QXG7_9GLOM|nr:hypothetical protein RCL_jg392.t1 [Rhizophagus clarus]
MSTSGEEMSDGSLLQLQTEETIEKFFKKNKTWSLLKFLNFRAENDDFTCNRRKEHGLYKKALNVLTTYVTAITQPDAYVPTGCSQAMVHSS